MVYILLLVVCTWRVGKSNSQNEKALLVLGGLLVTARLGMITNLYTQFPGLTAW